MLALLLSAFVMSSCDNDNGDYSQIVLPNADEKSQQAFADDMSTDGFTFTARQAWTATVSEAGTTRLNLSGGGATDGVDWLRLLHNGEETYSGEAGSFDMAIELNENYSGATRAATITIASGGDNIAISVTQNAKTAAGAVPVAPKPGEPVAGSRMVSKIVMSGGNEGAIDFTYDNKNRLVKVKSTTMLEPDNGDESPYPLNVEVTFDYSQIGSSVFKTTYSASSKYGSDSEVSTFTLSDKGYIISGQTRYEDGYFETWTGTYNSAGYITKTVWGGDSDFFTEATWAGGNLTWLYSGAGEAQTRYEYGTLANNPKCNLDLNSLGFDHDFFVAPDLVGLTGKRSAKMVRKETLTYPTNDPGYTILYTYTTDAQGFVTKITMNDGGVKNTVATITYL